MPAQKPVTTLPETKQAVDVILHKYCQMQRKKAAKQDASYERLWKTVDTYLQTGGKRIRPYLVVLAYEAYGGTDTNKIMPIAAAWELLHASLLIHDDIIDRDTVRHGKPNIAGVYAKTYNVLQGDAGHFADGAALLAGDLLLSGAHELVHASELGAEQKLHVTKQLIDALYCVAGGELMDVEAILHDIPDAKPLAIAEYKTAAYSFEFPLLCGATLAGISEIECGKISQLSRSLGVAYQLVDDLLGMFGEEAVTGKSVERDILDKKRTLLMQKTYKQLAAREQQNVATMFAPDYNMSKEAVATVRQYVEQSGSRQELQKTIETLCDDALRICKTLVIDAPYQGSFQELITHVRTRVK